MSEQRQTTVEEGVLNAALSEDMQKRMLDFVSFLKYNEFSIEPETGDDGIGWMIVYMNECVGHMNFANAGIWLDTCAFGGGDSADDALKETTWAHVRNCEHFSSGGKQCGCGRQPGFDKVIFVREHQNLCFALLEFLNPGAEEVESIKKLMLLYRKSKSDKRCS